MQKRILSVWALVTIMLIVVSCALSAGDPTGHVDTSLNTGSQNPTPDGLVDRSSLSAAPEVSITTYLPLVMRSWGGIQIGAFVGASPPTTSTVQAFESLAGRHVYSVLWYQGWDPVNQPSFPVPELTLVRYHDGYDTGVVSHLTWEPWVALTDIVSGTYDAYLTSYATQIKNWGAPVRLRFAHEMIQNNVKDGDEWYPWQDQPEEYKAAFHHVRAVFRAAGATNAEFVWCPQNYPFDLDTVKLYYPGPDDADWLCIDGYNSANPWQWFDDIFFNLYHTFVDHPEVFGVKPVMLGEFASCEAGVDEKSWETKPAWIRNTFERIQSADYAQLRAFYWFHIKKECDWQINSSAESLAAFKTVISTTVWASHPVSK